MKNVRRRECITTRRALLDAHFFLCVVHILSGDLILHKRTLEPIKTLVYGLRRYDVDRCAALIDSSDPANKNVQIVGFMSHKSKIYLADVYDHMEYILTSLDMFANIAENLINYSFNVSTAFENSVSDTDRHSNRLLPTK